MTVRASLTRRAGMRGPRPGVRCQPFHTAAGHWVEGQFAVWTPTLVRTDTEGPGWPDSDPAHEAAGRGCSTCSGVTDELAATGSSLRVELVWSPRSLQPEGRAVCTVIRWEAAKPIPVCRPPLAGVGGIRTPTGAHHPPVAALSVYRAYPTAR
jgi:hypothetical protein